MKEIQCFECADVFDEGSEVSGNEFPLSGSSDGVLLRTREGAGAIRVLVRSGGKVYSTLVSSKTIHRMLELAERRGETP